jgi:hypothetical protein
VSAALQADKSNVMRDRPTQTVEHKIDLGRIEGAIAAIEAEYAGIDGTADELTE